MKEGDQGGHLPPALHIIDKAATPATEALQGPPESPTRQPTPQHIFTLQTWGLRLSTVLWGFRTGSSSEPPGPTLSKSTTPQSHLLDRGQVLVPPPLPSCYWPEVGVWSAEAASRVFRSLQVTHKPGGCCNTLLLPAPISNNAFPRLAPPFLPQSAQALSSQQCPQEASTEPPWLRVPGDRGSDLQSPLPTMSSRKLCVVSAELRVPGEPTRECTLRSITVQRARCFSFTR